MEDGDPVTSSESDAERPRSGPDSKDGGDSGSGLKARFHQCRALEGVKGGRTCLLELIGDWVPLLPLDGWQDVVAHSTTGRELALIRWDLGPRGEPGFRVLVIDLDRRLVHRAPRIDGCCEKMWWSDAGAVMWRTDAGALGRFEP